MYVEIRKDRLQLAAVRGKLKKLQKYGSVIIENNKREA